MTKPYSKSDTLKHYIPDTAKFLTVQIVAISRDKIE